MAEDASFADLIRRVRAGEQDAATELFRRYEPDIRRVVRVRLTDPALRRVFDSMDICQSVLAKFFLRAAAGDFTLETPEQLLKLLAQMARNKVISRTLEQRAARRDYKRNERSVLDEGKEFAAPEMSLSELAANRELLLQVRQRFSAEEWHLLEQRTAGFSWVEIAAEVGAEPDTLRIRLQRALTRVRQEMPEE